MPLKVLILCKDYPPSNKIGGKRPHAWHKYLREFGIESTVITATPSPEATGDDKVYRVDCGVEQLENSLKLSNFTLLKRKFRSFFELWLPFLWPATSRYYPLYVKAADLINENRFDCIIATGEPFILFKFAEQLSIIKKIPWIADYRDPWINKGKNYFNNFADFIFKTSFYPIIEKRLISNARFVTTASNSYAAIVKNNTGTNNFKVVFNGHDVDFDIDIMPSNSIFQISYSGRLYNHQPIEPVVESYISFLIKNNFPDDICFSFFGINEYNQSGARVRHAAGNHLECFDFHKSLPYESYMNHMSSSHILLLLSERNVNWLNAKVFDYLILPGKIILFSGGDDELENMVSVQSQNYIARSQKLFEEFLQENYSNFKNKTFKPNSINRDAYSRKKYTSDLANLIVEICVESSDR